MIHRRIRISVLSAAGAALMTLWSSRDAPGARGCLAEVSDLTPGRVATDECCELVDAILMHSAVDPDPDDGRVERHRDAGIAIDLPPSMDPLPAETAQAHDWPPVQPGMWQIEARWTGSKGQPRHWTDTISQCRDPRTMFQGSGVEESSNEGAVSFGRPGCRMAGFMSRRSVWFGMSAWRPVSRRLRWTATGLS